MSERWYRSGVIYSLDVRSFQDSDGDGVGDLPGLISRLDYLSRLGVTALWLNPIHPTPMGDGGYDILDHYDIDPALGTLGDFAELMNRADERGLRVILDLVVNHTSDQHPWFTSACRDPHSRHRDWYVWSADEPPDRHRGMVFPGVETETWTYSDEAGAWYHHHFYRQEPDLDTSNPEVRAEIRRIVAFWARLGVSGFRIDAAPFLLERVQAGQETGRPDYDLLKELREDVSWHRGDSVFLAEANVPDDQIHHFFGRGEGMASRLQMLFAFRLNQALMLGLARRDATPVREALTTLPELPRHGQWATFLRGHDEVDLGGLAPDERAEVMAAFGPDARHQLYERGIRRRFAPMLDGDRRRIEMAYSLQFTMPGTPVLRYGDELAMGDDLALTERESVRTPMQWSDTGNGGFSGAEPGELVRPVVSDGPFGFQEVNVTDQRRDPESLLSWFERMIHTLRECAEVGLGAHRTIPVCEPAVLAHVAEAPSGAILFLHNLGDRPATVELPDPPDGDGEPIEMLDDGPYDEVDLKRLSLRPYGYRWIRLRRTHAYT